MGDAILQIGHQFDDQDGQRWQMAGQSNVRGDSFYLLRPVQSDGQLGLQKRTMAIGEFSQGVQDGTFTLVP